jgi:Protein of unknown function (DUF1501)
MSRPSNVSGDRRIVGLPSRRALLRVGCLGALGLTLPDLLRGEALGRDVDTIRAGKPIRSCIMIFYYGGPSHLDTWDMKPGAPREIRGEFRSIATKVPGLQICEHLPETARVMDRLAIVRGMHHPMTNHNAAAFSALCGRNPSKGDLELLGNDRNDPPCLGSSLSASLPEVGGLPVFVALPHVMYNVVQLPGQVAGFLGSAHDPFQLNTDPAAPDFRLGELDLPDGLRLDRLDRRADLLRTLDGDHQRVSPTPTSRDHYSERAFHLLRTDAVRRAFRLDEEDPRLRDRYGRNKHGQSVILARRLVEAGVRFVTVYDGQHNGQTANWDAHADVFGRLKDTLLPPADLAFAALIDDLTARGLLEETLVIATGEFGRTPRINSTGGRDHWPHCYSLIVAGGGVAAGSILGSSDRFGAHPETDAVTPADLAATILWRFGLDPSREMTDLTGRPYKLAEGQPIRTLFPSV